MDKHKLRKGIISGITIVGAIGVAKIIRNITPYEGPFGTIACYVAGALLTTASVDILETQVLKYEQFLTDLAEGDKMVVF